VQQQRQSRPTSPSSEVATVEMLKVGIEIKVATIEVEAEDQQISSQ
jgi:hypothetical protein